MGDAKREAIEAAERYTEDVCFRMIFEDGYLAAAERIAELEARVEELTALLPRWVPVAQKIALDIQGWLPLDDQKSGDSERQWLMVPPIPFPEEKA